MDVKKRAKISVRGAGHRVTGPREEPVRHRPQALGRDRLGAPARVGGTPPAWPPSRSPTTRRDRTPPAFFRRAVACYQAREITTQRVMSENGAVYRSDIHAVARRALKLKHLRTRAHRPRTNGKAKRFIKTLLPRLGLRRHLPLDSRTTSRAHRLG